MAVVGWKISKGDQPMAWLKGVVNIRSTILSGRCRHEVTGEMSYCRSQFLICVIPLLIAYNSSLNYSSSLPLCRLYKVLETEQWCLDCGNQNKSNYSPPIIQRSRNVARPIWAGFRPCRLLLIRSLFCGRYEHRRSFRRLTISVFLILKVAFHSTV